jgi:hypothetical protein
MRAVPRKGVIDNGSSADEMPVFTVEGILSGAITFTWTADEQDEGTAAPEPTV